MRTESKDLMLIQWHLETGWVEQSQSQLTPIQKQKRCHRKHP